MYRHVGIVRRSDSGVDAAGEVGEIALVGVSFDIVVTAVRSASDTLKVIKWRIGRFGAVKRLDDSGSDAGEASHISAAVNGDLLVTAVRSGSDNLKLIAWDVGLGVLERLGDSGSLSGRGRPHRDRLPDADFVPDRVPRRQRQPETHFLAGRSGHRSIHALADSGSQAGAVEEISMVQMPVAGADFLVVTTVRSGSKNAVCIAWTVTADGLSIDRGADSGDQIGEAALIRSALDGFGNLVVSCQTAAKTLKLISLVVTADGQTIKRAGDSGDQAGRIRDNSLVSRPYGAVSAVSTADGILKLIAWQIDADGAVTRLGDTGNGQAGKASLITTATSGYQTARMVTAVRSASDDLVLVTWDDQPVNGEI